MRRSTKLRLNLFLVELSFEGFVKSFSARMNGKMLCRNQTINVSRRECASDHMVGTTIPHPRRRPLSATLRFQLSTLTRSCHSLGDSLPFSRSCKQMLTRKTPKPKLHGWKEANKTQFLTLPRHELMPKQRGLELFSAGEDEIT